MSVLDVPLRREMVVARFPTRWSPRQVDERVSVDASSCLAAVLLVSSKVLGHPVRPEQSFVAAGGDSLLAVELLMALEAELGAEIDEDIVLAPGSFRELADRIFVETTRASLLYGT